MDNAHRPAGRIGMIMGEGQGVGRFNTQFEDDLNRDALIRCIQGSAQFAMVSPFTYSSMR